MACLISSTIASISARIGTSHNLVERPESDVLIPAQTERDISRAVPGL